ncbi:hypothetical protein [Burkholderia cepacia]|uniref:hypothetical protein n=1 Tax=Burkholderia cepacia TaxID=292 RepID=UPI001F3A1EBB|nr:hypothetical protein [Burkholderia cepacia]UIY58119.1 hypothetical protein LZ568_07865 [Burkholderia cepacia]
MRTKWTAEQLLEFRAWHNHRLAELQYPQAIAEELVRARERWLPAQQVEYVCADQAVRNCG